MLNKAKAAIAINRIEEEQLFEIAAEEVKKGTIREGLMAKAFSETKGNQEQANALYLKLRVQSLKDEADLNKAYEEEILKQAEREAEFLKQRKSFQPKTSGKEPISTESYIKQLILLILGCFALPMVIWVLLSVK